MGQCLSLIHISGQHNQWAPLGAMAIRKLCEKSGVSTGAFYHHYHSKEDLPSQGFASFDQELQAYLAQADDADTVGMIRFVVLSLNQYVFDNAAGFAKELYISQLSIKDSYITRKDRPYNRAVLKYVERAQDCLLYTSRCV